MAVSSVSLSQPLPPSAFFSHKPRFSLKFRSSSVQSTSFSILPTSLYSQHSNFTHFPSQTISQKNAKFWRISVAPEDVLPSDAPIDEATRKLLPAAASNDGVTTIISSLLFIAFIGLSILTIGVVYIAVTDFLQKREKDKFEKEETEKKSRKKKKKGVPRAKTGPRGFGQKIEVEEDDD